MSSSGWPRGRITWVFGSVLLLVVGVLIGLILSNVWLGLLLAVLVSIGWLIAYESQRGHNPGLHDDDDDGARL